MSCCNDKPLTTYFCDCNGQPIVPKRCPGAETCDELVDAHCVVYRDPHDLNVIHVYNGTRLDQALINIDAAIRSQTQAITTEDTSTVDITGNGLQSSPLKADVKISSKTGNLITRENDGLAVVFNAANITTILTIIKNDPALSVLFCQMIAQCQSNATCGTIQKASVSIS